MEHRLSVTIIPRVTWYESQLAHINMLVVNGLASNRHQASNCHADSTLNIMFRESYYAAWISCYIHLSSRCHSDNALHNRTVRAITSAPKTIRTAITGAWPSACNMVTRHHNDVIMGPMASQITSITSVYSTIYSGTDQRKHQSSASLAFVRGIHRWPMNSPHKGPVTQKMFPFDDVIMVTSIWCMYLRQVFVKHTIDRQNLTEYNVRHFGRRCLYLETSSGISSLFNM